MWNSLSHHIGRTIVFAIALLVASHATATEAVKNGSFEGGEDNCSPGVTDPRCQWGFVDNASVSDQPHTGKNGAVVGGLGSAKARLFQELQLKPGIYSFVFWYKASTGGDVTPSIVRIAGKTVFLQFVLPEGTPVWKQYQRYVQVDKADDHAIMEFVSEVPPHYAGPSFLIDDVSFNDFRSDAAQSTPR